MRQLIAALFLAGALAACSSRDDGFPKGPPRFSTLPFTTIDKTEQGGHTTARNVHICNPAEWEAFFLGRDSTPPMPDFSDEIAIAVTLGTSPPGSSIEITRIDIARTATDTVATVHVVERIGAVGELSSLVTPQHVVKAPLVAPHYLYVRTRQP